ncbi:DNA2/NAM7 helicase, helicase domain [Dillenia turbinata]|uniref:DNA2/NAM7 helicase, helicase domain n=1 Tax=Dillenia turbinata TaxID=194707 RepID=A0AAN8ZSQ5_9MAGN
MAVDANKQVEEESFIVRFCKIVLSWDYLRLLKESDKKDSKANGGLGLNKVKDTFTDVKDYISTFEPLLFEEVKAQIVQGRDDEEVTEWNLGAVAKCSEVDGFHLAEIAYEADKGESISQNDLLLLSREKFQESSKLPTTYVFAMVEHRQMNVLRVRMYLAGEVKQFNVDDVKSCPRLALMRSLITETGKSLWILKICSLSTITREYVGMHSISSLPFKDLILSAAESQSASEDSSWEIPGPLMKFIESNHNTSQLVAIHAGLSRRSFTLIQGPPGTGKTQTILGLLSAILHATPPRVHSKGRLRELRRGPELPIQEKFSHWIQASPWLAGINPRDAIMPVDGDDGFFPTGNELKPDVINSSRKYRVRVLVCAPSNSALDEIVLRVLNTGIRDENGFAYHPKIVRIGLKPHHSVQAVSMDYLVEQKLAGQDLFSADKHKKGDRGRDRDSIRASVLDEAVIVFSTLSFSGSTLFSKLNRGFDVVIIDEAAQAVEPATLVPLGNGCKQVGDPIQLPATVISPVAEKFGYGTSMFKRFQRAGYPVQMLKTQYRMHPQIRSFPSKEFYDEALEDGPDVEIQTRRSWHDYRCFGPFCFFDIIEGKESQPSGSGSWVNVDEVDFVLLMHRKLVTRYPELESSSRLAIISPYRHQVKLFIERFRDIYGTVSAEKVDINTVDGFQGREKDVAIFSCVRASKDRGIGFVADYRRMNVGITRARSSVLVPYMEAVLGLFLQVVGSASTLEKDEHWRNLVASAKERDSFFQVSKPYASFFSDESLKNLEVKDEPMTEDMGVSLEEVDNDASMYGNNVDEVGQGPAEEHDFGDGGDGDGGYDGGFGED